MWALLAAVALAANVEVAGTAGPLHPGVPAQVLVAVTDADGRPSDRAPRVEVQGGSARFEAVAAPGIWAYLVVPPNDGASVRFDVTALGEITTRLVPMEAKALSRLVLPRRIDALAGAGEVTFRVTGDDLPPPESLAVVVGSGSVTGIEAADGALEVTLALDPSPFPRFVPVGVTDLRRDEQPAWTGLRLRTRPRIALQTDPGTTLSLTVGSRSYGPFSADEEGIVAGTVDQYPGEMLAQAVFTDDLGNVTVTSLPLSSHTQPAMVALPTGAIVPGRTPPVVYVRAVHGDGHPWEGADPACRTPAIGDLGVHKLAAGEWMLPLTELRGPQQDLRVHCTMGGAIEQSFRIPLAEGLASRLRLRVWPEELSTDFPVAEVQVILEDARGERMPVQGVRIEAEFGAVDLEPLTGFVARGEYRGTAAVDAGQDIIRARYDLPAGTGAPSRVVVGHGPVPSAGDVEVYGRALDGQGLPVAGVDLALSAGAGPAYGTTGPDGWARAVVPLPDGRGPVVFTVRHPNRTRQTLALRGADGFGGPGVPELSTTRVIPITAGEADDLFIDLDPPVLYTGGNAIALISVSVRDRAGNPVTDASPEVGVSEGSVGPVTSDGQGGYRAEYVPPPGDRPREVAVTAKHENASASAVLMLEPRPIGRAVGISFGVISNLGAITSPFLSVDADFRTPWFGRSLLLRAGFATYGDVAVVDTGLGEDARIRITLVPITVGLIGRQESRGRALWLGIGGVIAPYRNEASIGDEVASRGLGVLPPGLEILGGVGQRFAGGELMLELRAMTLSSPGGAATYQGPVGGVVGVLGYRLVY